MTRAVSVFVFDLHLFRKKEDNGWTCIDVALHSAVLQACRHPDRWRLHLSAGGSQSGTHQCYDGLEHPGSVLCLYAWVFMNINSLAKL